MPPNLQPSHWPNPMAKGQWGQSAILTGALNNDKNKGVGLVRLEALVREHPLTFTIDLWAQTTRSGVSAASPIAVIEWGSDAAPLSAEVDFAKGARVRVAGTYVRVNGYLENSPAGKADVSAAANVENASSSLLSCTRTFEDTITHGNSATKEIPNWAKDFIVYRSDNTVPFNVQIVDSFLNVLAEYDFAAGAANNMLVPIRLPGPTDGVIINNTDPANPAIFTTIFGLGF